MTTPNIATAAIHVVGQYNEAGKTLVGAWRAGAHRLIDGAASRAPRFLAAQDKISGFLANRLDIDTGRMVAVMDRVAAGTTSGIESAAKVAARVESPLGRSVLGTLGSLHMPFATISVQIADRIAAGAKQIETRVAGAEASEPKAARTVKARPAPRRNVRASRKA